jgi:hypothetical protein
MSSAAMRGAPSGSEAAGAVGSDGAIGSVTLPAYQAVRPAQDKAAAIPGDDRRFDYAY